MAPVSSLFLMFLISLFYTFSKIQETIWKSGKQEGKGLCLTQEQSNIQYPTLKSKEQGGRGHGEWVDLDTPILISRSLGHWIFLVGYWIFS